MSNDSDKSPADDTSLFRRAMKDVRRLDNDAQVVRKKPPPPTPAQSRRDQDDVLEEMANGELNSEELEYGDEVFFQRPGISRTVMRKLRRGQFAVQAEIDLHGLGTADAKANLSAFLQRCSERGMACVRVIHGKGHRSPGKMPVLKPKVAHWLSRWDNVSAFASARPVDGGTGALYVLLKTR